MQANVKSHETSTDREGNYIIHLSELFGNINQRVSLSFTYRVTLVQEQVDVNKEIELHPDFVNSSFFKINPFVTYKCNYTKIQAKG